MTTNYEKGSSLALLATQRRHLLFVLSRPQAGHEAAFRDWYQGAFRQAVLNDGVLSAQHYEQHEVDITQGRWPRLPFQYLALYELSLDGAAQADSAIDRITKLHREQHAARRRPGFTIRQLRRWVAIRPSVPRC